MREVGIIQATWPVVYDTPGAVFLHGREATTRRLTTGAHSHCPKSCSCASIQTLDINHALITNIHYLVLAAPTLTSLPSSLCHYSSLNAKIHAAFRQSQYYLN